jgi:hypothetical protein
LSIAAHLAVGAGRGRRQSKKLLVVEKLPKAAVNEQAAVFNRDRELAAASGVDKISLAQRQAIAAGEVVAEDVEGRAV